MNTKKTKSTKKLPKPPVNQKSVLALGYGPLNTDYGIKDPKGLWEKIRKGEVSETYLGDDIGSIYTRNTPRAGDENPTIKAMKQGTVVMANPRAKKQSTKKTKKTEDDTIVTRSGGKRTATDAEQKSFIKALFGDREETGAAKKETTRKK